jgi:pimeloyl-ACP methyl ester carboxylesterase
MSSLSAQEWTRTHIDDRSYIDKRSNHPQPHVLVFVHGIFGSSQSTWQQTPLALKTLDSLSSFDFAFYGYRSAKFESRPPEEFVVQLRTWAVAHLHAYDLISFAAHSMGGLFVRHLCIYLANSESPEDHELLRKIRQCFLIASPISGSWASTLLWWTGAGLFNSRVSYLSKPRVRGRGMADAYRAAARRMDDLGIPRPKFSLYYGDSDRIVYHPNAA